jgi:hypothetical protein
MPDNIEALQREANDFLRFSAPEVTIAAPQAGGGGVEQPPPPPQPFSPFDPAQMTEAARLTEEFIALANQVGGVEGVEAVIRRAREEAAARNPDLVRHSFELFITHHREGSRLTIPSLAQIMPEAVMGYDPAVGAIPTPFATGPEAQLNYFRDDPFANDHHTHWHRVYVWRGIAGADGVKRLKKQHGEMFLYMHQQMLARYDAERLAFGLPGVEPLDYTQPLAEFDPQLNNFNARPAGMSLPAEHPFIVQHLTTRERLRAAAEAGLFQHPGADSAAVTVESLGNTAEASIASVSIQPGGTPAEPPDPQPDDFYGLYHNLGHSLVASLNDGAKVDAQGRPYPGVMSSPRWAIRDPDFWRWHKDVDDIYFHWQQHRPANDLSDAPQARIRKALRADAAENRSPDIILCLADNAVIPGSEDEQFDGAALGQAAFGGEHWDEEFSAGGVATDTLYTIMREAQLPDGRVYSHLDHDKEFFYFIRAENLRETAQDVTVRIFLAPRQRADDRRSWIEMDKFKHTLGPREKAVIFRPSRLASVIRKEAEEGTEPKDDYCECGWPYSLLLPRGTGDGMGFRLFVILTDADKDQIVADRRCGSISFCGLRDNKYPDSREMGYPFNRRFPHGDSIAETVRQQTNVATRDFNIQLRGPEL